MQFIIKFISLICFISAVWVSASANELSEYKLGSGDTISIYVYGHNDLTLTAKLDDSGKISYPFIGDIIIKDKTTRQIRQEITQKLKAGYLVAPQVHVSVAQYRPFYVYGQVNKPGSFAYQPGLTVVMAIALAGGLTERASNNWFIKRSQQSIQVEASDEDLIYPGDMLTIEKSFF